MHSKEVEITCKDGLHLRPATRFVQKAKEFKDTKITVFCKDSEGKTSQADAKSLFKFQMLSLEKGVKMLIQAEGENEQEAVDALATLITEIE
jgi:phosphocarrier protein HPr